MHLEYFDIGIPEPKLVTVNVPGRDGELDMSKAVTGYVTYHNRIIHLQFGLVGSDEICENNRSKFFTGFHTKTVQVRFSHLNGYFKGQVIVDKVTREYQHYTVYVRVICEPYRYSNQLLTRTITLSSTAKTEHFSNLMMHTTPTIRTTGNTTIEFENKRYVVGQGEHRLGIVFKPMMNTLKLSGTGQCTISYQTGVL